MWLAAELLGGLSLGQEVSPSQGNDIQFGSSSAVALRQGVWVKLDLVRIEDAAVYSEDRRPLFIPDGDTQPLNLVDRLREEPPSKEAGSSDEVRTLWVDYDEQGERHKRWRDAVKESFTPAFDQQPLEGPLSALHVMKHTERHGGDPRQWLLQWMRSKHIEQSDRVYHELKVITDSLYYAATFDQVNVPALLSMEVLCRRLQAICDAYSNPNKPTWDNARVFSGQGSPDDIVSPAIRTFALRKNKDELELLQARIKVRELRGSPSTAPADEGDDQPPGTCKPKGGRKGGGRGSFLPGARLPAGHKGGRHVGRWLCPLALTWTARAFSAAKVCNAPRKTRLLQISPETLGSNSQESWRRE